MDPASSANSIGSASIRSASIRSASIGSASIGSATSSWQQLLDSGVHSDRVRHVEQLPARPGVRVPWPSWADPTVVEALQVTTGGGLPWRHQVEA
ncbi:MAG: hypothetical protein ACRYF3_03625, partial [Janthinobacterium lividum]